MNLPLYIRRSIITEWADELVGLPASRQWRGSMRVDDAFCALGLFAELCVRHLPQFEWVVVEDGEETSSTYAISRPGTTGLDIRGLPYELQAILGFSDAEVARISSWNDDNVPFAEIADRLRATYVDEFTPLISPASHWPIVANHLPTRNRNPDYLAQMGGGSVWAVVSRESRGPVGVEVWS